MHASNQSAGTTVLSDELLDELDDVVVRMARMMASRHLDPEACIGNLTLAQVMLLRALSVHGAAKMSDVAAILAVKAPAASAAVAQLERDGRVERAIDPHDRRVTSVHVTEVGLAALHEAEAHRRAAIRRFISALGERDITELIRIHRVLIAAMEEGRA